MEHSLPRPSLLHLLQFRLQDVATTTPAVGTVKLRRLPSNLAESLSQYLVDYSSRIFAVAVLEPEPEPVLVLELHAVTGVAVVAVLRVQLSVVIVGGGDEELGGRPADRHVVDVVVVVVVVVAAEA